MRWPASTTSSTSCSRSTSQPSFWVDQSVGVVFDRLLAPPPFTDGRCAAVLASLQAVRPTLAEAHAQLPGHAFAEFAAVTVAELAAIEQQLAQMAGALSPFLPEGARGSLEPASEDAGRALGEFRDWLATASSALPPWQAIGEEAFRRFLTDVALVPETPADLLALSRLEMARAVALSQAEATRPGATAAVRIFPDVESQVRREAQDEAAIRTFYAEHRILSQPETLRHYLTAPMPDYVAPLRWLGVTDDLTSEHRLDEDGVSFVPNPSPALSYFYAANAHDPRCGIVHEGVHYQQLALSWRHSDPIRRHYYDSCPNEGIAFYNEELMLQAGLFDDDLASRAVMLSFMRLRALRVEVDVRLALGDLSLADAASRLQRLVPMDEQTATEEAASFAAAPGQGLTYQLGKTQIQQFLADATQQQGEAFDLRAFHDYLWLNGNVPIPLLRREYFARAGATGR